MTYSDAFYEAAIYFNRKNAVELPDFTPHPVDSRGFVDVVATFQKAHELTVDGKCGAMTATLFRQELMDGGEVRTLTRDDLIGVALEISKFEGKFDAMNRDGEFRGLFDRPPKSWHWASKNNPDNEHGIHVGLSYGFIQFTQDSGQLGKLLKMMSAANSSKFKQVFGPKSEELLEVTNRPGKARTFSDFGEDGLRSPRVQPVGGEDLWDSAHWTASFKEAATVPEFHRAQLELAVEDYVKPALKLCEDFDLRSERAVAFAFDRCVQYGASGARKKLFGLTPRQAGEGEHAYLLRFMRKYEDKRWGHRLETLWRLPVFWDGPCDWTGV